MTGRADPSRLDTGASLPAFERLAPAPSPTLLAARIEAHSGPGDVVADLAGRGGWVARAALDHQRRAVSIESMPLTRMLAEVVLRPPDVRHLDAAFQGMAASPRGESSLKVSVGDLFATRCATCGRMLVADEFTWAVDEPADVGGTGSAARADDAVEDPTATDQSPTADDDTDGAADGAFAADGPLAAAATSDVHARSMFPPWGGRDARPVTRHYRCSVCRDQRGGPEARQGALDPDDLRRAASRVDFEAARTTLLGRFPAVEGAPDLVDEILALHTPRQLVTLVAILERIEGDLRAAPVLAALRLSLLHAILPSSRLVASGGRSGTLRVAGGHVRLPGATQWRERNPWVAFEEGFRLVRGFVHRLEGGATGPLPARLGEDLRALGEGSATAVLAIASPSAVRALRDERPVYERTSPAPRVRLVLGQPPVRPTLDRLAAAYHGTAWVLGHEAASLLPIDALADTSLRAPWSWQAVTVARALAAVEPSMARDGRVIQLVDDGPEALAAVALGGASAGYRTVVARLADPEEDAPGIIELVPPGAIVPPGPRTRANQGLPAIPGGPGDPDLVPGPGLFAPPERYDQRPFSPTEAARIVTAVAVETLQARGEPARFERLFGEILVGLDRSGQLRRFAAGSQPAAGQDDAARGPASDPDAGATTDAPRPTPSPDPADAHRTARGREQADVRPRASGGPSAESGRVLDASWGGATTRPDAWAIAGATGTTSGDASRGNPPSTTARATMREAAPDPVDRLMAIIRDELARPTQQRLEEIEPGRWWLGDRPDRDAAAAPLADRVEWAVFSLLSTAGPLSEAAFFERMATMFSGHDLPDETLIRACLDSYRGAGSTAQRLVTDDDLLRRSQEHADLLAAIADGGHRMGMHVWLAAREQARRHGTGTLGERLEPRERDAYLGNLSRAPEALAEVDAMWYVRGKIAFLFEVEWTAILGETLLRRHARIPPDERLIRFLVVPPERTDLVRHKLERSPLLRAAIDEGDWHILKWDHLRTFLAGDPPDLAQLEPLLGLDPQVERRGEQMPLFGS